MYDLVLYEVQNQQFKRIAIMPYKSLVWEECYDTCGSMQCVIPRSDDALSKVRTNIFADFSAAQALMYIHSIKITDTEIWLYGYEAKALFEKKFAISMMTASMQKVNVLNKISQMVYGNGMRWLGNTIGEEIGDPAGENLGALEYNNMLEFITQCCKIDNCGFFVGCDKVNGDMSVGHLYLSHGNTSPITLSKKLGNISDITYTYTDKPRYNEVVVFGLNNNDTINIQTVQNDTDPDFIVGEVYTAFLDLRLEFPQGEDVSDDDYDDALETRGRISLGLRHSKQTIEVKNITQDLQWGDIVKVVLPDLNVSAYKRVTAVTYTVEAGIMSKKYKLSEV